MEYIVTNLKKFIHNYKDYIIYIIVYNTLRKTYNKIF